MELQEMVQLIANNGFAIFVAIYMLIYQNKTMQTLTDAVNSLSGLLQRLIDTSHLEVDEDE